MHRGIGQWYLGSAMGSNEEVRRARLTVFAQVTRQFKAYKRAHAMTEKGEWYVHIGTQRMVQRLHERREAGKKRFSQPNFPSREIDGAHLYLRRQSLWPEAEN